MHDIRVHIKGIELTATSSCIGGHERQELWVSFTRHQWNTTTEKNG